VTSPHRGGVDRAPYRGADGDGGADRDGGAERDGGGAPARRLDGVEDLLTLAAADAYVLADADPDRVFSVWAGRSGSFGWVVASRRVAGRGHLVALGPAGAAAALLVGVVAEDGTDIGSVSLPRDADRGLPPTYVLDPRNDWEWLWTGDAPPVHDREAAVDWLGADDMDDVRRLVTRWSLRHDAVPGAPGVLRWCGIRDGTGELVATAAHTEHRAGVPRLASIVTHGGRRGQGLGAAVTTWLTRRLLDEGTGIVTLGMYSDNDVARRLYERLGFTCAHALTSGRLVVRP